MSTKIRILGSAIFLLAAAISIFLFVKEYLPKKLLTKVAVEQFIVYESADRTSLRSEILVNIENNHPRTVSLRLTKLTFLFKDFNREIKIPSCAVSVSPNDSKLCTLVVSNDPALEEILKIPPSSDLHNCAFQFSIGNNEEYTLTVPNDSVARCLYYLLPVFSDTLEASELGLVPYYTGMRLFSHGQATTDSALVFVNRDNNMYMKEFNIMLHKQGGGVELFDYRVNPYRRTFGGIYWGLLISDVHKLSFQSAEHHFPPSILDNNIHTQFVSAYDYSKYSQFVHYSFSKVRYDSNLVKYERRSKYNIFVVGERPDRITLLDSVLVSQGFVTSFGPNLYGSFITHFGIATGHIAAWGEYAAMESKFNKEIRAIEASLVPSGAFLFAPQVLETSMLKDIHSALELELGISNVYDFILSDNEFTTPSDLIDSKTVILYVNFIDSVKLGDSLDFQRWIPQLLANGVKGYTID